MGHTGKICILAIFFALSCSVIWYTSICFLSNAVMMWVCSCTKGYIRGVWIDVIFNMFKNKMMWLLWAGTVPRLPPRPPRRPCRCSPSPAEICISLTKAHHLSKYFNLNLSIQFYLHRCAWCRLLLKSLAVCSYPSIWTALGAHYYL